MTTDLYQAPITYLNCLITVGNRDGKLIPTILIPEQSVKINLHPVKSLDEAMTKAQAYIETSAALQ